MQQTKEQNQILSGLTACYNFIPIILRLYKRNHFFLFFTCQFHLLSSVVILAGWLAEHLINMKTAQQIVDRILLSSSTHNTTTHPLPTLSFLFDSSRLDLPCKRSCSRRTSTALYAAVTAFIVKITFAILYVGSIATTSIFPNAARRKQSQMNEREKWIKVYIYIDCVRQTVLQFQR